MWFRQLQVFKLPSSGFRLSINKLSEQLSQLAFSECLPLMSTSVGWVAPCPDEEDKLFRAINDCFMLCLEVEEKILPASVIKKVLQEKIKKIETEEGRKIYAKEKNTLKDEVIITLLPRAFGRRQQIFGYIDLNKQLLFVATGSPKRAEQFVSVFKKTFSNELSQLRFDNLSGKMTEWLKNTPLTKPFTVGDSCMMQDQAQQGRVIRCRQQDLFQDGIQSLLKTGCLVKQMSLSWHDQLDFTLTDVGIIQGISFQEDVITKSRELDPESIGQQFDADFFIFSNIFSEFLDDFIKLVGGVSSYKVENPESKQTSVA